MKRTKRILALFLAMAMVLGMSMTTFAASNTPNVTHKSNITVKDLSKESAATVKLYRMIYLDTDTNDWIVEEWAKSFVNLNNDTKAYDLVKGENFDESLKEAAVTAASNDNSILIDTQQGTGTVIFRNVPVGTYAVIATDDANSVTYSAMVASNFDPHVENGVMAIAKDVYAKLDSYKIEKKADKEIAGYGETVQFTIETTFPSFEEDLVGNSYTIVDTPTGLALNSTASLKIGGTEKGNVDVTKNEETGTYIIDLSSYIGTVSDDDFNGNAGLSVEITYNAVVTEITGYRNTANSFRNNTELGEAEDPTPDPIDPDDPLAGYTGSIVVKKVDASDTTQTALMDAEFEVYKNNDDTNPLKFVEIGDGDGVYRIAITEAVKLNDVTVVNADNEAEITTIVKAPKGTVTIKGLGEGTYHFKETKAPDGYAVDDNTNSTAPAMADVKITKNDLDLESTNQSLDKMDRVITWSDNYLNSTLGTLPSTGGIGTTIFTVGGCAIMIIAAGLYFASRRRAVK